MSESNKAALAVAAPAQPRALLSIANITGLDQQYLVDTIKRQCFKGDCDDAQVDAFISIACEMKVNPLLPGMLYAYPISGGGIVPIMGPSGVYKKLTEHPDVDSWETTVFPEDVTQPPTHAIAKIFRKGAERPLVYTALLSEWAIQSNPNWKTRPRHMLGLRALKHCANQIIHGIPYDEDDRVIMQNVTGTAEGASEAPAAPVRPVPPEKAKRGAAAVRDNPPEEKAAPKKDDPKIVEAELVEEKPAAPVEDIQAAMKAREAKLAKPGPRGSLNDQEKITAVCKVEGWKVVAAADGTPTVQATVSGDFNGVVFHKNGADKDLKVFPEWKAEKPVSLELVGKLMKKSGKISVLVESITIAEAQPESPAAEVE